MQIPLAQLQLEINQTTIQLEQAEVEARKAQDEHANAVEANPALLTRLRHALETVQIHQRSLDELQSSKQDALAA